MSAMSAAPPAGAPAPHQGMSQGRKVLYSLLGVWIGGIVLFIILFGFKSHKAPAVVSGVFSPTNEFKLDTWFKLGPIAFNKGVLYLLITVAITIGVMLYIARRLQQRPGRLQVAVEAFYRLHPRHVERKPRRRHAAQVLPVDRHDLRVHPRHQPDRLHPAADQQRRDVQTVRCDIPSFQIYAADTNVAFPLILALGVFVLFTYEGVRHHGPIGYVKSLMPGGIKGPIVGLIFPIEILSNFLRLISLTVRLWANLLAGHMLIAFMGGELGVLVGDQWVQWLLLPFGIAIYLFEAVLIAGLQAFIFSILTAIYLGGAVESH